MENNAYCVRFGFCFVKLNGVGFEMQPIVYPRAHLVPKLMCVI
jgi:hypothetical protein